MYTWYVRLLDREQETREKESPKTADVQTGQKYQPNKQFTDFNSNNNRITVAHGIRFLFRNSYFMCLLCSHSNIFFTSFYYWWWCCCFHEIGRYWECFYCGIHTHRQTNHHCYCRCFRRRRRRHRRRRCCFMWCLHLLFHLAIFHMIQPLVAVIYDCPI